MWGFYFGEFMNLALVENLTMNSREIAELTGKEISHIHRDIRNMLDELKDDPELDHVTEDKDARGYTNCFHLTKSLTMTLMSGYNVVMRKRIIDRWQELEKAVKTDIAIPDFSNPVIAARAWADAMEAKQVAMMQLSHAVATKAEIGSRREATSMATASVAVRQANTLRKELGKSRNNATIRAVNKATGEEFQFRPLSNWCKAHEIAPEYVIDPLYGQVRSYPSEAWDEVYGIKLDRLFK